MELDLREGNGTHERKPVQTRQPLRERQRQPHEAEHHEQVTNQRAAERVSRRGASCADREDGPARERSLWCHAPGGIDAPADTRTMLPGPSLPVKRGALSDRLSLPSET